MTDKSGTGADEVRTGDDLVDSGDDLRGPWKLSDV